MQEAIEREHAALAVVLRLQHEEGVFDRDDKGQRPDHERNGAERVLWRARRRNAENLVHRVERGRADVAIDDAERAQRQRPDASVRSTVAAPPPRWRVRGRGVGSGVIERTLSCSRAKERSRRHFATPSRTNQPYSSSCLAGDWNPAALRDLSAHGRDSRPAKAGVTRRESKELTVKLPLLSAAMSLPSLKRSWRTRRRRSGTGLDASCGCEQDARPPACAARRLGISASASRTF